MKELIEYREKLINRLQEAAEKFYTACASAPKDTRAGEWTLHQIAFHTRDVQKLVYGARITRTLNEEKPHFDDFDADQWMESNYREDEAFESILDEFRENVQALCKSLRAMPQQAWSRESSHQTAGTGLTLQLWVERSLAHIEEHYNAITNS